jgi:hypothetical protein
MRILLLTFSCLLVISQGLKVSQGVECESIRGFSTSSFLASPSNLCTPYKVKWSGRFTDNYCTSDYSVTETLNGKSTYKSLIRHVTCYNANDIRTLEFMVNPFRCLPGTYTIEININESDNSGLDRSISCQLFSYTIS